MRGEVECLLIGGRRAIFTGLEVINAYHVQKVKPMRWREPEREAERAVD